MQHMKSIMIIMWQYQTVKHNVQGLHQKKNYLAVALEQLSVLCQMIPCNNLNRLMYYSYKFHLVNSETGNRM